MNRVREESAGMANRAKAKGYRGEVEILQMMQGIVTEEFQREGCAGLAPELKRSPNGRDIVGVPWIAPEVKRHEPTNGYDEVTENQKAGWWQQCKINAGNNREPVLLYRANFQPWKCRMFVRVETPRSMVRAPADVSLEVFQVWFRLRIREELQLQLGR